MGAQLYQLGYVSYHSCRDLAKEQEAFSEAEAIVLRGDAAGQAHQKITGDHKEWPRCGAHAGVQNGTPRDPTGRVSETRNGRNVRTQYTEHRLPR